MPDIVKSRDAGKDNKQFSSFLQILIKQSSFLFLIHKSPATFSAEVFKSCNDFGVAEETHEESSRVR